MKDAQSVAKRALVVARLERARSEQLLVTLVRRSANVSAVRGFVAGVGRRWVAVAVLDDDRTVLDGWSLLRLRDLLAVAIEPDPACFEIKALQARSLWPVGQVQFELDDVVSAVRSAAAVGAVIGVSAAELAPVDYWIGSVKSVSKKTVIMRCITRGGRWKRKLSAIPAAGISRLNVGGIDNDAYELVAGPEPQG